MKQLVKIVFITVLFTFSIARVWSANIIRTVSVSVNTGSECVIQVQVDNTDAFVAFQADIPIPAGFSYIAESAQLVPARSSGHTLSASLLGSTLRLIAYSGSNTAFSGNSGTLITFSVKAGTVPGNYSMTLNNTLLGNSQSQSLAHSIQNGLVTVLGPNFRGSATTLDFGRVALTTNGTQYVNIQNTGNQNLVVSGITFTDAQFTSPESGGFTLTSGQTRQVSVKFAPTVKGTYSKQMKILSNDPDTPEAIVALKSVGFAVNELRTVNMVAASGTNKMLEFTLNNMEPFTGLQFDIKLTSPMKYIGGSAVLSRQQDHSVQADTINSNTLRVVAFSASGKNFTGTNGKIVSLDFALKGVAGNYPVQISNVIIANTEGENILSASYNGTLQITSPDIHAVNQLNFGDVSVLSEGNQTLRIYNYGQEQLTVSQLMFSSDYFKSTQSLPFSVAPSGYYDLPVRFVKTIKGISNGTLKIISNDADENPFTVQLSGNAYVPNHIIAGSYSVMQGNKVDVQVEVNNKEPFVAFQFDLDFPEGLTPDLNGIALTSRKVDHLFASTLISERKLRVIAWSGGQKSFTGETGLVIKIPFQTSLAMPVGNYQLTLSNGLLSNSASENVLYSMQNGNLTVQQRVTVQQSIDLNVGWNIISINVIPENLSMMNIFQSLITDSKLKKVMDESGKTVEDWGVYGSWKNNIGDLIGTEGYKVNVNTATTLTVEGTPNQFPFEIELKTGWNIISWPSQNEQDGMDVFQPLIDAGKLKKVMDEAGKTIEDWGIYGSWKNGIYNFKPGEGYNVNVTSDCTLTINDVGIKSQEIMPEIAASTHFLPIYPGNGTDHMNIHLVSLAESGIFDGDEIGVFDGNICVGSAKINIQNSSISIPVSANDDAEVKSGYTEGNTIELRLYRNGNEYPLTIQPLSESKTIFERGSSLFAQVDLATSMKGRIAGTNQPEINCYPNPFSDEINIEIKLAKDSEVQVEVLNQLGQRVKFLQSLKMLNSGIHRLMWDGKNAGNQQVSTGIYHLRIKVEDSILIRKLVYSK
jgi:hypothetical protein